MASFIEKAASLLKTAGELAALQGDADEAKILKHAKASLIETGYDNWDGGITSYTLALEVPLKMFSKVEKNREGCEKSIRDRVNGITRGDAANVISEVIITPILLDDGEETDSSQESSEDSIPTFWQPNYFRLFISHTSGVKKAAHSLKEALAPFQIAAFVAHDDIEPSLEWQLEIESALRTMDAMVAIITTKFSTSKWCDQEVGYALGRSKFVQPLTTNISPHGFLAKIQALNVEGLKFEQMAQKVSDILIKNPSTAPRMTETLVESLVKSTSWDMSRRILKLIEKVPALTSSQVGRLLAAADQNDEVKKAFYGSTTVPEKIQELAKKHTE